VITVDYLANHRDAIPDLARYFFDEWRVVYEKRGLSLHDIVAACEGRAQTDKLPVALVALENGAVIGTGALKLDDLELRPTLNPWLGGLFVLPSHRNRGIATTLIKRLLDEARRLDLSILYLWTLSAESLYARLGWKTVEQLDYCDYSISLMQLTL
jgi:N-acetylglutamate synthase-like GNAT family acetyltransferase